jgi:acyl-CoA reductase-like NAD-dependent aldehyde dehydrogenase
VSRLARAEIQARRLAQVACHGAVADQYVAQIGIGAHTRRPVHDEAQMPFGGVKDSGWGRFGGKAGIDAFTDLRWVKLQTTARQYSF